MRASFVKVRDHGQSDMAQSRSAVNEAFHEAFLADNEERREHADAVASRAFREYLASCGAAEELVKLMVSYNQSWGVEAAPHLPRDQGAQERMAMLSTSDAPDGKFSSALPETVQGRDAATFVKGMSDENASLKENISVLEAQLAAPVEELEGRGYVQMVRLTVTGLAVSGVPEMEPYAARRRAHPLRHRATPAAHCPRAAPPW